MISPTRHTYSLLIGNVVFGNDLQDFIFKPKIGPPFIPFLWPLMSLVYYAGCL